MMPMEVILISLSDGTNPVRDFIKNLQPFEQKKVYRWLERLEQFGRGLLASGDLQKMPGRTDLFELIAGDFRVFGVPIGQQFYAVHGIRKPGRKAKSKDLVLAERRIAELKKSI
ncbi:MAG: type II toxin-antitoxin system RelE/ParE family toxin [Candidatus Uhrbacteria bacterium]|nr:type II toxin-antitoxin system RelE/ParE family toxin [Candidatus Uhrbacteria bacterium]